MLDKLLWMDDYDRTARLVPGLLVVLPIAIVLIGLGVRENPLSATLSVVAVTVGAPLVLAKHVRRRGRKLEKRLIAEWGGLPTTRLLVPEPDGSIGALRQQRRRNVERISGIRLPSEGKLSSLESEEFEAAIRTLRAKTADRVAFPQVYAENKSYGFERNLKGVRAEGLVVSAISAAALVTFATLSWTNYLELDPWPLAISACFSLVILVFWLVWPTSERVQEAGQLYAERVLDAAQMLPDADARP